MPKITDKEILDLLINPNKRELGFQLLVKSYSSKLYWTIRRILLDHDDTNDVLQNTFIKIWQNIETFRKEAKLFTWIYRIAINETLSFIKSNRARYISFSESDNSETIIQSLIADTYFKANSIEIKLQRAILKLPEKQRLVFILRYFKKMKYNDMAKILNANVNTLKANYHFAIEKIEKFLSEY